MSFPWPEAEALARERQETAEALRAASSTAAGAAAAAVGIEGGDGDLGSIGGIGGSSGGQEEGLSAAPPSDSHFQAPAAVAPLSPSSPSYGGGGGVRSPPSWGEKVGETYHMRRERSVGCLVLLNIANIGGSSAHGRALEYKAHRMAVFCFDFRTGVGAIAVFAQGCEDRKTTGNQMR